MIFFIINRKEVSLISKFNIFILIPYLLFTSCLKVQEFESAIELSVSTDSLGFTSDGEQKSLNIVTNMLWTASSDVTSWCMVSPTSGSGDSQITVSVSAHTGESSRKATVTVTAGNQSRQIHVVQSNNTTELKGVLMVNIHAGTFKMGSLDGYFSDEQPQHSVTLSAFRLSENAITNEEYCRFLNENEIDMNGQGIVKGLSGVRNLIYAYLWGVVYSNGQWHPQTGYANHPVVHVTWFGAKAFCDWAGGRLPTEAEWEYACRAGTTTEFNTGQHLTSSQANYYSSSTKPVGSYAPNAWGLYDMHGNVWEWCNDYWDSRYYDYSPTVNPQGPGSAYASFRVYRGGSWSTVSASNCSSTYRSSNNPYYHDFNVGFRMAASAL